MPTRNFIRIALLSGIMALAGCQDMDPYSRTDMWQPTGANAGNLAAQVANPYDLIRGRGSDRADGTPSNIAIGRIRNDLPKPLINPGGYNTTGIISGGTGSGAGGTSGSGGGSTSGGN